MPPTLQNEGGVGSVKPPSSTYHWPCRAVGTVQLRRTSRRPSCPGQAFSTTGMRSPEASRGRTSQCIRLGLSFPLLSNCFALLRSFLPACSGFLVFLERHAVAIRHHLVLRLSALFCSVVAIDPFTNWTRHRVSPCTEKYYRLSNETIACSNECVK